ncbi:MAG TPA: signal recognition particle-docking protein FtsY [Gemmatimonas aurantiaca]|uniref:Signal recognition particle receptor FtsY n=2 Tax=Gemmatimonas aurantiaca TaxID=173480 RepID=C1A8C4_GEMAT|nr:signal recognition particle-docking protein FtsY [Gemmatimonas aurantiaca]BAH38484.1 cell division protein FtsY [Gemmatimonas aurantiaca T-27]HCT56189.1 signal recognition particle-docking protein FtsY [Gemmatimonas aurantiaca]
MSRLFRRKDDVPKRSLWQRVKDIVRTDVSVLFKGVDEGSLEALETLLIESDFGVPTSLALVAEVERRHKRGEVKTEAEFRQALADGVANALRTGNADPAMAMAASGPTVLLVIGVNGAGKTTFIGKLAAQYRAQGKRVLVGAADTFRAGAIDQLRVWAERSGAEFVGGKPGSDPASVAYDAVDAGIARNMDLIIVDTAGRLHTSDDLMTELRKMHRVIGKRMPEAPHEILLVLDGTIGQNALSQARTFSSAVPVTGVVVTKLDGTAKGGIVVAVHEALNVPIKYVGVGEQVGDLEPFDADVYAKELVEA